jgi:glutaredoxin
MRTRFLVPLLFLPILAQAQLYRWTDEAGNVHFSDRIPPSGAKNVQKKFVPAQTSSAPLPYALQQAVGNFPVTLYTSKECLDTCARARELLDKRGVPYSEVIVTDKSDLAKLKSVSGDHAVPVMTVGREVYKGFESGRYKVALDTAGYPASSLLPPGVEARKLVAKPAPKPAPAAPAAAPPANETESAPAAAPQNAADAPAADGQQ